MLFKDIKPGMKVKISRPQGSSPEGHWLISMYKHINQIAIIRKVQQPYVYLQNLGYYWYASDFELAEREWDE